jgi:peptidoglycan L-alanyl-D-glutamate endopeptidase CwlK
MSAGLSPSSINKLQTCHKDIQAVVLALVPECPWIIQVIEGKRSLDRQKELLKARATRTLKSNHVTGDKPSNAVDLAPVIAGEILWKRADLFQDLAKRFLKKADELYEKRIITSRFRWGGDWNMNGKTDDEKFRDLVHFERII